MAVACTVPGSKLLLATLLNPIFISALATPLIITLLLVRYADYLVKSEAQRRVLRYVAPVVVAAAYIVVLVVAYSTTMPGVEYGLVVEDGVARVTFLGSQSVTVNACNATIKLLTLDEALSMLKRRDYGLGDPLTKTYMGYFTGRDGRSYLVAIIEGPRHVLYINDGVHRVLVGVEGVEKCYEALLSSCTR